ncbi:MAG: glycosyltransferase involved in cell wall biosynthesis [Flavobacteriales bacterium]|jgi:glycosyltransferase involved in cell wall biosynthesis
MPIIDVIIPAFNEQGSIGKVVSDIPKALVREIIVVNNNSTDQTEKVALDVGATVILDSRRGYGSACLKGLAHVRAKEIKPDIVVFLDGDYSDHPEEMTLLVNPILNNKMDMVIGSRALGKREKGSMMPQQKFGNWLATSLLKLLYKISYTDLGPFRAITWTALEKLNMQDTNFGWTVEMQLKAAKQKMNITETPVSYRKRIGVSKIAGTLKGTILAGYKIIFTIFKYW